MNISAIRGNVIANNYGLQTSTKFQASKGQSYQEIQDTYTESEETSRFRDIVKDYDITNISRNEANDMFKDLADEGLISFRDYLTMSFDPTRMPGWQNGVNSISGWKISSNADEKMNYLEGFKTQAWFNRMYGDVNDQQKFDSRVELVEKIHHFQKD